MEIFQDGQFNRKERRERKETEVWLFVFSAFFAVKFFGRTSGMDFWAGMAFGGARFMSLQRDYILRLLDQLREFLAQVTRLRLADRPDDALLAIMHAQERLFGREASLFLGMAPEQQFRALTLGEAAAEARGKCVMQADLLAEMARVYADNKEQPALALGAWQYARELLELTAQQFPGADIEERIAVVRKEIALLR